MSSLRNHRANIVFGFLGALTSREELTKRGSAFHVLIPEHSFASGGTYDVRFTTGNKVIGIFGAIVRTNSGILQISLHEDANAIIGTEAIPVNQNRNLAAANPPEFSFFHGAAVGDLGTTVKELTINADNAGTKQAIRAPLPGTIMLKPNTQHVIRMVHADTGTRDAELELEYCELG